MIELKVHAGWKPGTKITFENKGDEPPGSRVAGDLVFVIKEKAHPRFKREGDDLITSVSIPLVQALTGAEPPTVLTLDGRPVRVHLAPGIVQPGTVVAVPGEGMPNSKTGQKGSLRVRVDVELPRSLTAEQKAELKRILSH